MSKKLIAVASAAALALTGLVGVAPANATAASIAYAATGGDGSISTPYTAVVPHANSISSGVNSLRITVSGLLAGDTVTVSSAGSAKIVADEIAASTLIKVTNFGASSLTDTVAGAATTSVFYVYDTQIANASLLTIAIKETDAGVVATSTTTKYFKATVGVAHQMTDLTVADSVAASTVIKATFKIKDVFGNELSADTIASVLVGGTEVDSGIATYDASRKLYEVATTSPSNTDPFIITLTGGSPVGDNGLGASSLKQIKIINSAAAAAANVTATAQIAALTAQIAALQVIVDRKVTKKRYNTLARKWNRAFPSQKVWVKP
jgi:hypothetical protein